MSQGEIVRPGRSRPRSGRDGLAADPAAARLIREGNTDALRRRLAELIAEGDFGEAALDDETLAHGPRPVPRLRRSASRRTPIAGICEDELIPLEVIEELARARRLRPHRAGGLWRARPRQARHVRGDRGAVARLYRPGLARHALGDRRRADPPRRHARRRSSAGCRNLARARSCPRRSSPSPTPAPISAALKHPRRARRRRLPHHRQQDLDHPCRAQRSDDPAGAHRSDSSRTIAASRCSSPRSRAARRRTPSPRRA